MNSPSPDAAPFREPAFATDPLRLDGCLQDGRPASLTLDGERLIWDVPRRAVHAGEQAVDPLSEVTAVLVSRTRAGRATAPGLMIAGLGVISLWPPRPHEELPAYPAVLAAVVVLAAALVLPRALRPRTAVRVRAGSRERALLVDAALFGRATELVERIRRARPEVVTTPPLGVGAFLAGELRALFASGAVLAAGYEVAGATSAAQARYVARRRGIAAWNLACWVVLPSVAAWSSASSSSGLVAGLAAVVTYVVALIALLAAQAVVLRVLRRRRSS